MKCSIKLLEISVVRIMSMFQVLSWLAIWSNSYISEALKVYSDDRATRNFPEDSVLWQQTAQPNLICQANNTKQHICLEYNSTSLNCIEAPNNVLQCIDGRVKILDCYCVNYNGDEGTVEFGKCFYNCNRVKQSSLFDDAYNNLTDIKGSNLGSPCQSIFSRSGTLCGKCKSNLYPLVYSYKLSCVNCTTFKANIVLYLLKVYLPLTAFCVCIILFKLNTTSSHLEGFILTCQGISLPMIARTIYLTHQYEQVPYIKGTNVLLTVYGIWNLDILRALNLNLCLQLDTLSVFCLDLALGAFPLVFMTVVYFLTKVQGLDKILKPLGCLNMVLNVKTSLIDAFGTFFVLSHIKFMNVCFDLLLSTEVYILPISGNLTSSLRWYYDANVAYFGEEHKPVAILCIFILLLFVGVPLFLLVAYPFRVFQQCLNKTACRWYVLHTFMDMFHACYKDGTEPGSRDCRWFASVLIVTRFALCLTGLLTLNAVYFGYASMILVIVVIVILIIQPYRENLGRHTFSNLMFIILLASFYTSLCTVIAADESHHRLIHVFYGVALIFATIPLLYLCGLVTQWIFKSLSCCSFVKF